jgi:glucosamine kinase
MSDLIYVGVDGGGTKTAAVVVDRSMNVLGRGTGGPSNHLRVGLEEAAHEIERAVGEAVRESGRSMEDVEYAFCGIAGADHPAHRAKVIGSLRELFPDGNFTVDNDARIALTGAAGPAAGIVIIAGTGSVAFGRNDDGREARAGGWGPTIGDEGSGYSIARRGLSAIVRSFDGRSPRTLMTEYLCNRHGMCDPSDLPQFVYAPSTHADDIAIFCKLVMDAAAAGDPLASEIVETEGAELGKTVVAVAKKLKLLDREFPVAYVGGVFQAGAMILDPLRTVIHRDAPLARLQPPNETPVLGAARMAISAAAHARPERRKQRV